MTTVSPIRAKSFITPVSGVSFRQEWVRDLKVNEPVFLRRDPENRFDAHAIRVENRKGDLLGFIPREVAPRVAAMDAPRWSGQVVEILKNQTWGIRVRVTPVDTDYPDLPDVTAEKVEVTTPTSPDEVYSTSGRLLGSLVKKAGELVLVKNAEGKTRAYPQSRVQITGD